MSNDEKAQRQTELSSNSGCFKIVIGLVLVSACSAIFEAVSNGMNDGPVKGMLFITLILISALIIYGVMRFNPLDSEGITEFSKEKTLSQIDIGFGPPIKLALKVQDKLMLEKKNSELGELQDLVDSHSSALQRNLNKCTSVDEYGAQKIDGWREELEKFFLSVQFLPKILSHEEALNAASDRVVLSQQDFELIDVDDVSGLGFERYCAVKLEQVSWSCEISKPGADQGVDIVASKNGFVVVVQCKDHSRPVGNKAVQEALAGQSFEFANKAVVISRSGFTQAAVKLAERTGVILLKPEDIINFSDHVIG